VQGDESSEEEEVDEISSPKKQKLEAAKRKSKL
jgi:hypothetical protein